MLTTWRWSTTTDSFHMGEIEMTKNQPPIHPGEILKEDFMEPLGLSANKLAQTLSVPANRVSDVVRGRRDVTGDTALRLEKAFGVSARFWMNLQAEFDLRKARSDADPAVFDQIRSLRDAG